MPPGIRVRSPLFLQRLPVNIRRRFGAGQCLDQLDSKFRRRARAPAGDEIAVYYDPVGGKDAPLETALESRIARRLSARQHARLLQNHRGGGANSGY